MLKIIAVAIATLLASANLASAMSKHERDIEKINAALPGAKISKTQRARVIKLRNQGARHHYAGNHKAAQIELEQAKAILHIH